MKRPRCEWRKHNDDACKAKATQMVGFIHNDRFLLSCEAHAESWQHRCHGWWVAKLQGFSGDWDNMIEDMIADNQRSAEARRAYEYQLKRKWEEEAMKEIE